MHEQGRGAGVAANPNDENRRDREERCKPAHRSALEKHNAELKDRSGSAALGPEDRTPQTASMGSKPDGWSARDRGRWPVW
jgi:hypothetical protein